MSKKYFDVIVIAPLEEEFQAAIEYFSFVEDLSSDNLIKFHVTILDKDIDILLVKQNEMGRTAAQEAALTCMKIYDAGFLACIGIAGGLSGDLNIGDVCHSGKIIDVLDNAKASENSNSEQEISFSPTNYDTPLELSVTVSVDRINPESRPKFKSWSDLRGIASRLLVPDKFLGKKGLSEQIQNPKVVQGTIACASVSGSPKYNQKLKAIDRKVLAVETESGGVFSVAKSFGIPAITIRGISDYAGIDKNRFEEETNNKAREIAAANAFTFFEYIVSRPKTMAYIYGLRITRKALASNSVSLKPEDLLVATLLANENQFHEKLRDLAPGFALQEKGYRLPIPRVRVVETSAGISESDNKAMEIREAIKETNVLCVLVPNHYPDHSLSWVIANDLLSRQFKDRQLVPFVVDFDSIMRGTGELISRLPVSFEGLYNTAQVNAVVIIDNAKFDKGPRIKFLIEEIVKWTNATFIIVTRSPRHKISDTDFLSKTSAELAVVCEISFVEIAHFLQKNFEMAGPASEVVATRLHETFHNFDLYAHPTYFAGIPKQILDALLKANRRAELLELAVVGYLTVVVALDDQAVTLSRTTRERFLTEFALRQVIGQEKFTEIDLIKFADQYAKDRDFDISAPRFIASFIDKGILHVDEGVVVFSLPFMQDFLLAKKLVTKPEVALKYFDYHAPEFNGQAFAIYAELGVSEDFIEKLFFDLEYSIVELEDRKQAVSVFSGAGPMPAMMLDQKRLVNMQRQLEKATADVRNDEDQTHEKQRILDASDRIRREASKLQDDASAETEEELERKKSVESRALGVWYSTICLLGSGAERLNSDTKRKLILNIVNLSTLIIEDWTRLVTKIDFETLKSHILKEDEIVENLFENNPSKTKRDAERTLSSLVDLLEFSFLMQPFRVITECLCDEARDAVLAESIIKVKGQNNLQDLLLAMWLGDIDTIQGKPKILEAVKSYPQSKFIRVSLATHLITRVYWKHWKKEDRLSLLDAAAESLKITEMKYDKFGIVKMIKAASTETDKESE